VGLTIVGQLLSESHLKFIKMCLNLVCGDEAERPKRVPEYELTPTVQGVRDMSMSPLHVAFEQLMIILLVENVVLLWNKMVHCYFHTNVPLDTSLSQMVVDCTLTSFLFGTF
jgi:hypothetical protein